MSDRIIVSVAAGTHYERLQARTFSACQRFGEADLQFRVHRDVWHYELKLDAIYRAGRRYVMWMDVSFAPVASLEPLWRHIEESGWFAAIQGDSKLGTWVSDDALIAYGITREDAMRIPLCFSGIVGLDLDNGVGAEILYRWNALRHTFHGAHYNRQGEEQKPLGNKFTGHVSWDPAVEGHRHDESALSFVLSQMGLTPLRTRFLGIEQEDGFIIGRNFVNVDGTYAS